MKKLITIIIAAFICLPLFAQEEAHVDSKISKVTVYQKGAEVSRTAKAQIPSGASTIVFSGLSSKLDKESVQVKASGNVSVLSVVHNLDFIDNTLKLDKEIQKLTDRSEFLMDSINICNSLLDVYQVEEEMLKANKSIGGDNGVSADQLADAAKFFRQRLTEIQLKTLGLKKEKGKYLEERNKIARQLNELNANKTEKTSKVTVKLNAKAAVNSTFEIKYIVQDAAWEAFYDVRIDDTNKPLTLVYKANVYQNSNEDWDKVKLVLSTGDPSISNFKPELETYYLTFNNFYRKSEASRLDFSSFDKTISGKILDQDNQPLPGATIMIAGTNIGTVTDYDGNYQLRVPAGENLIRVAFIGFTTQEFNIGGRRKIDVVMQEEAVMLDEVVVTGLTGSASGVSSKSRNYQPKIKKEHIPISITKQQTNTTFDIKVPYTIPSDNKDYDVQMLEYEIPATYEFSSVPKLSEETYLIANIPDWTDYKLLDGDVNLFFNGVYQGQTYLDLDTPDDTLSLSVGRDKEIMVKRELKKDFSSKQSIGSNKKEVKAWEITVKNNKKHAVTVLLEDQYPVSKEGEIKVDLLESSGAKIDEAEGKLRWKLELKAGETKKLLLKYEVKYPKDKKVIVD